jgi:hypothetical protein
MTNEMMCVEDVGNQKQMEGFLRGCYPLFRKAEKEGYRMSVLIADRVFPANTIEDMETLCEEAFQIVKGLGKIVCRVFFKTP